MVSENLQNTQQNTANVRLYPYSTYSDDSSAVQRACDDIAALGGGLVYLPPGDYNFLRPVFVQNNTKLEGAGSNATRITGTASGSFGGVHRALVEIATSTQGLSANTSVTDIGFYCNGPMCAISTFAAQNCSIERCLFTGNGSGVSYINISARSATTNVRNVRVRNCQFAGTSPTMWGIQIETTVTYTMSGVSIEGCDFINVAQYGIHFTENGGIISGINIIGNSFTDLVCVGASYSFAVHGGLLVAGVIQNVEIISNTYRNSRSGDYGHIFVGAYSSLDWSIIGNTATVTARGNANNTSFIAPGRVANPMTGLKIIGNTCDGFGAFWDADSMIHVEVANNIVRNCNPAGGLTVGYSTQKHIDIHDNLFYNSWYNIVPAAIFMANVSPAAVNVKVHDNIIIDEGYSLGSPTALASNGTTITVTIPNNLCPSGGQTITISGATPAGYNATWVVATASATQFTIATAVNPGPGTVMGTVQVQAANIYGLATSGAGAFDSSDVEITRNRIYMPNAPLTAWLFKQNVANIPPAIVKDNEVHSSAGFQYQFTGQLTAPAIPASTTPQSNTFRVPVMVVVSGGTVSQISINGVNTGLTSGAFVVPASGTITLTYSVAPTWTWIQF